MSERMVNDLTLQYFTSRDFGSKIQKMTTPEGDDEMLKDKKIIIGTISRLVPQKDLGTLIKAFDLFLNENQVHSSK